MADFDVIVVGAGCAGSVAAYQAAQAGKSVLLIERGEYAGAKNMTGGRIYTHSLEKVFPDFRESAPLERRVAHERLSFLDARAAFTVDYSSEAMAVEGQESYTVLRASFDQWLAEKAEEAGAECIYGIAVEHLLKEGGRVTGITAAGDDITADVVILADGVNSLLSAEATGAVLPAANQLAVGIKQVVKLDAGVIEDRFLLGEGEGASWLFVGDSTHGHVGGGFVYTNKESVSLGLVATISDLYTARTPVYQMLEDFKQRSDIAPLLRGGEVVEHSGHMVPEGGYAIVPPLFADGVVIAGDAAMLCINLGYCVRGMDFAIASGAAAAQAAVAALEAGDTSAQKLSGYRDMLEQSFVLADLKAFARFPGYMEHTTRLFNEYPAMLRKMMDALFIVDGSPVQPLKKKIMPPVREVGLLNIWKDVRGGMKAL